MYYSCNDCPKQQVGPNATCCGDKFRKEKFSWQRFKYRLTNLKQRAKDIWTIVSGGDVHKNCGDW